MLGWSDAYGQILDVQTLVLSTELLKYKYRMKNRGWAIVSVVLTVLGYSRSDGYSKRFERIE